MKIGISAVAAFKQPRTGVEEYTYQLIKHLLALKKSSEYTFNLYCKDINDFYCRQLFPVLPENFKVKRMGWPFPAWTQARLSTEMLFKKPDLLFIPAHVLPVIHPRNSVVTVHGLEYEYYPELYSKKHLLYLRLATKYSAKYAQKIIAVSENTKKDLIKLYNADPDKIKVVYHGLDDGLDDKNKNSIPEKNNQKNLDYPYFLFLGRIETKKNVRGIIRAFDLLKEKYHLPHKLILAGLKGYGYKSIKSRINSSRHKDDIIEKGYIKDDEKWQLLKNAEAFLFTSFYEGFGLPILEAQSVGCPVITSDISSMPEVAGDGALLVDPNKIEQITQGMYKLIKDNEHKLNLTKKGYQNIKRFKWQKCAEETLKVLVE